MTAEPATTVRRLRPLQDHDTAALEQVLAEGLVAHVGVLREGWPVVLPFAYAVGDLGDGLGRRLLLHGSTGGGVFLDVGAGGGERGDGVPVSVAVTHLDGLVFARSLYDSSMNYRCAVVFGRASVVTRELSATALALIGEHLMPGRGAEVRPMSAKEAAATCVLQVPLERWSVKISAGDPDEADDDGEDHEVWAGVLPLALRPSEPVTSPLTSRAAPVPASVRESRRLREA